MKFWDEYYARKSETPAELAEKVRLLRMEQKFGDVEAVLWNYLSHHRRNAQYWMYTLLAVTMDLNGRKPELALVSLRYAANLAEKTENPAAMMEVADLLFARGETQRVAKLLDTARKKSPYQAQPRLMTITLAVKTKDPARMTAAAEELLELGWPGVDEQIRAHVRKQADIVAKALRSDQRFAEADSLEASVGDAEHRDLVIRLSWEGDADLDIIVEEPKGAKARILTPCTTGGGSILNNGYGKTPEEYYACPRAINGPYKVSLDVVYNNPKDPAKTATIEAIFDEGRPTERRETKTVRAERNGPPVVFTVKDGRRAQPLPEVGPLAVMKKFAEMLAAPIAPRPTPPTPKP